MQTQEHIEQLGTKIPLIPQNHVLFPSKADGPSNHQLITRKQSLVDSLLELAPSDIKSSIEPIINELDVKEKMFVKARKKYIKYTKPVSMTNFLSKLMRSKDVVDVYDKLRADYESSLDEAAAKITKELQAVDADLSKIELKTESRRSSQTSTSSVSTSSMLDIEYSTEDLGQYTLMEGRGKISLVGVAQEPEKYRRSLFQLTKTRLNVYRFSKNGTLKFVLSASLDTVSVRPAKHTIELISAQSLSYGPDRFKNGYKIVLKFTNEETCGQWALNLARNAKFAFEFLLCGQDKKNTIGSKTGSALLAELHRVPRNKHCGTDDCKELAPTWADLVQFKLICQSCAGRERGKPGAIVRSILMDSTCWTEEVIDQLSK